MKRSRHTANRRNIVTGFCLALAVGLLPALFSSARAQEFRYEYVSLENLPLPPGIDGFFPVGLDGSGRVYGTAWSMSDFESIETLVEYLAYYEDGEVVILREGSASNVNRGGTVGGAVLIGFDYDLFPPDPSPIYQAAIFHDDQTEMIPPLPDEFFSFVIAITESGIALVESFDSEFGSTRFLYKNGEVVMLPASVGASNINNRGWLAGTRFIDDETGYRGYVYEPSTGETRLLDPVAPDSHAWGMGISQRGDVLGYSFDFNGRERIGVWNRKGEFRTYFVQGTAEIPTFSNVLRFNDNNLIAVSDTIHVDPASGTVQFFKESFLIPKPGVRLKVSDLVLNPPETPGAFRRIEQVTNRGDLFGFGNEGNFLLKRVDAVQ